MKSPLKFFFILNLLIPLVGCSGLTHAPTQYSNQKDLKAAIRAVQNQDLNNLRSIISKNNAILNGMEDSKGNTLLDIAVLKGTLEIVEYLVSAGANVNYRNSSDGTPLVIAIKNEKFDLIAYLLNQGANVNLASQFNDTPLPTAVGRGELEIVKLIVSHGADLNVKNNNKETPLLIALENNYSEIAEYLISKDANVNIKNQGGKYPLHIAAYNENLEVVKRLVSLRWNLNSNDNLLIYYAGHSWLDKDADEGFWLPVNAQKDNMLAWISNSSITAILRALKAKHVLIVADSCYSGKLARGVNIVNKPPGYLSRLSRTKARCVISSGGLEPVIDSGGDGLHSVFAAAFLSALKEKNDILDGEQLFNKLRRPVMLNSDQTPQYSDIRKAGHEGGEFLFVKKR